MKNLIYLFLSFCMILLGLGACSDNTTGGGGSNKPTLEKVADMLNVQQGAWQAYRESLNENGDTLAALEAMGRWIGSNPAVEKAYYHDLQTIEIFYKNGLKSSILIIPTDENGIHLQRGSGPSSVLKQFNFDENTTLQEIKNDKVLVLIPYSEEFKYYDFKIAELRESFSKGDQKLTVDIVLDREVGLDDINRMGEYGFIIIDTHGLKNGFLIGSFSREFEKTNPWLAESWSPEKVRQELLEPYNIPIDKIENGEIEISQSITLKMKTKLTPDGPVEYEVDVFSLSILVTENYIRNAGIDLEDAVVFGNHCYSGYTADGPTKNNMSEAWRSKGVAAYYGYAFDDGLSRPVINSFALAMEKLLIKRLVQDTDSTGAAHLKEDGSRYNEDSIVEWRYFRSPKPVMLTPSNGQTKVRDPFYFNHYFATDYSYETCGTFTDPRDGEEYELACIGDQTWFAENLRYDAAGGRKPEGKEVAVHGLLYNYNSATGGAVWLEGDAPIQGICPQDWHVPHRYDWKTLLKELGSATDVLMRAHPDSIRKTVIRLAGADPNLNDYEQYKDDPELNQSGFNALATGWGEVSTSGGNIGPYQSVISGDPTFWSSSPMVPRFDGEGNVIGGYDTESRWHLELDMSERLIWVTLAHPTVVNYYNPIRCVKD